MSHTGSWVWDVRCAAPVYWSAEMCRIHGRDAAAGPPSIEEYRALHRPEDWLGWITALQKCIQDRADVDCYCRLALSGGLVKHIRITGHPIVGVADEVTEIIGSTTEVRAEGQGDLANQTSGDFVGPVIRPVIDLVPALAWSARRDGSLEYCNRVWLDYTGLSAEEAMNWGWTEAIHPDDLDRLTVYWQSVLAAGEPGEIEARLRRFDGDYRWFLFRTRPQRDDSGAVIKWYGTNIDIEDRRRAEEALRHSERELHLLVDSVPGMIATANSNGQHDYANKRALDYTGTTVDDSWDLGFIGTIHPEEQELVKNEWIRCATLGVPMDICHRWRRFDGVYRWFHVRVDPLMDDQGKILRWYGLLTDIEDQRQAEDALLKSQSRLARMSQIMTVAELSASIAHEINQPLAAVLANGHACRTWLSADPPNLDRARATAENMIRDTNSASEVVRRMRALFKQAPPAMALSDMNDMIGEVLKLIGNEIRDARITVETDLAVDLPSIVVDRVQIQQMLINLARNAIEAMEAVTDRSKALLLVSRREGVEILIQVRDSGCGITDPTSIFDAFFTTSEKGMGMGLAICRSIIEVHGGRLWATPNEGAGTTFHFTLPFCADVLA